ncbi:chitobiase/beta-hexosaminidase C-terminal domain-containing protein [Leptospira meyeri]|uniref:chitobiase/beta-hexosaminidase C-terminal domain-containing protein n=1 Tax=Leptospira meyeri TaxID=29508 RepID=UPI0002BF6FD2|nr:chitobiase/beta-hexosaminidase C-terminal domain-containing protein [Leptospira meyeri]EMJ88704.1 chitobiase/beta-hexosaminidase C-terminal domain protein [Leptospira meyeri serovar Semaranga str. Veldrot Semarang 173]
MRIPKQIYHLSFLFLFTNNCLLFFPNGNNQTDFSLFAFLFGLVGGSPTSSQNLTPGATIDLSGDGKKDGTLVDSDGDGVSDGINLTGGTTPNLILIDTNGDGIPDAIDSNGDGLPDYYISPNPPGFLTTGPGGTGNPVVIIVDGSGNPIGFDTDGDGTPNDTAIVTILGDTTSPTITSSLLTGTFSTTQTTTLTCSDNKAPGSIVYTLDASTPSFSPKHGTIIVSSSKAISLSSEGTHTLQAICRDLAGNVSTPISIVYTIDTKIPALTLVSQSATAISASAGAISSSTATWRSDRSGSFTVREGSSCDSGTIATTGSVTANVDQGFVRSHTHFTGEGTKTYRVCVTGSNGLIGFVSVSLQRDDTAPVVTADPGAGNYGVATSVSLSCSDTGGAGCDQIAYAVQAGSAPSNPAIQGTTGTVSSGTLYTSAISMTDGAVTYTKFVARDKAGNVSGVNTANYTVDTQVATITVNSHTAAINGSSNVSISWQSSKAGSYQIRLGGSSCANGTALTNTGNNANVSGNAATTTDITSTIANSYFTEGDNTIRICVANLIGGFGSTTRNSNKDTTAPVVTMASPSGSGPFVSGTQLQLSCSDTGGSGCDKMIYTLNGTEPTFDGSGAVTNGIVYSSPVALANGSNQVKYLARDLAGNLSTGGNQSFHVGPPNAPAFVEAQAGETSAIVQWWPVTGATSYTVYYSTSPGVTTASTSFGPVTDPYVTITGLTSGTLYYFRVVVNNALGSSAVSLFEAIALTTVTAPGTNVSGTHVDISAGQGLSAAGNSSISGAVQSFNIDSINQKILVVTTNDANDGKPGLFRCDFDGSNCSHTDLSAGQGSNSGRYPNAVIDYTNQKLLVVTRNVSNNSKPSLFRCNLDGTSCTHSDISAGQGTYSAGEAIQHTTGPKIVIDNFNQKLLVVSANDANSGKLSLFRCEFDGSNCSHTDISAGQGANSGKFLNLLIDQTNRKLLSFTTNEANGGKTSLYRCNLDGSNCIHIDISSGYVGYFPSPNIDYTNMKLIVATQRGSTTGGAPSLIRCNLDGTNCSNTDIAATPNLNQSYRYIGSTLDMNNGKVLVAINDLQNSYKPKLIRCDLAGTNCSYKDISAGQGMYSGTFPVVLINQYTGKLFVVTQNGANSRKPSLFIW